MQMGTVVFIIFPPNFLLLKQLPANLITPATLLTKQLTYSVLA
jgi:hypothetical protein